MCRTLDSAVVLYSFSGCLHARGLIKDGKRSAENTHAHTHTGHSAPHSSFFYIVSIPQGYGPVYELAEHAQFVSGDIGGVKRPSITELLFAAEKTVKVTLGK